MMSRLWKFFFGRNNEDNLSDEESDVDQERGSSTDKESDDQEGSSSGDEESVDYKAQKEVSDM